MTGKVILTSVLSAMLGVAMLSAGALSPKWALGFLGLFGVVCVGVLSKDPERFFLGLFFVTLPLPIANFVGQLSTLHRGGPPGYFILLSDLPLAMLYCLWIPKLISGSAEKVRLSFGSWCIFGVIVMSVMSMWNAADIQFCGYELVRLLVLLLLYLYMANAPAVRRHLDTILIAAVLGLLAEGVLGIFQVVSGRGIGLRLTGQGAGLVRFEGFLRAGGTLGHPNTFALYLGLLLPVALSMLAANKALIRRTLFGSAAILGTTALILTLSRGGWTGFLLSLCIWLVLVFRFRLVPTTRLVIAISLGLALFLGAFMLFHEPITTRLLVDDQGSAYSRIPLMKVAFNMIQAHPFLGVGLNNYLLVMSQYDDTAQGMAFYFLNVVHNSYLLIASEIGIPGLLCFLGLPLFALQRAWQFLKMKGDRMLSLLVVGVLAGFGGLFWQMLVENVYLTYHSILMFWAFAGLMESLVRLPAGYARMRPAFIKAMHAAAVAP